MKKVFFLFIFLISLLKTQAQTTTEKKPPSIGLHFFYNDFATPALIKTSSIGNVISNKKWAQPQNMEGGFGIDYLQGFTKKIDLIGTINASWVNYQLPDGSFYGSSNFLLDVNAGAHIKLLADKKTFNPFLITKIGYAAYKNIKGFSILPGAGVQVNLFNEAMILTTIEYKTALNYSLSDQLYYSIGITTNFIKKKTKKRSPPIEEKVVAVVEKEPIKEVAINKKIVKNIVVTVLDEATGQPLPSVAVSIKNNAGILFTSQTNTNGKVIVEHVPAADYIVTAKFHNIDASSALISLDDFTKSNSELVVTLTHNDPRFTLVGNTINVTANKPVGGTAVTITNQTLGFATVTISDDSTGKFSTQLEAVSDFIIVGKKSSYISNIENISTKNLNRSAILYVKLALGIEAAKTGASIVLNKINFETGKATINTNSSGDLDKLILFLKDNPAAKLEIQGHTDNVGMASANFKLSQLRANSVVNYLVTHGVDKKRLTAKGYGPSMPIADNLTKKGMAENRRVEMKVIE